MLLVNEILHGRYRIIRQLGHGGMGAVYEAHDSVFETTVALKEIMIDTGKSQNSKQQDLILRAFEREAKILAKIKHEAVPHVRDYFTDTNRQFLVMELVEGKDLGGLLEERSSPFPLEDVLRWMEQLLDGLDYLHTQNPPIYHRDLKPQNLKITPRGRIKLLDFGIAKGGAEMPNSTTINNQTFVAATLNYSPIEQIFRVLDPVFREVLTQRFEARIQAVMEQNADARSDLYALGATAYHLLTGVLPIDALKRTMEIWSNRPDPLTNPMALNRQIPFEISNILLKAMQVEHDHRYASALEMQTALHKAIANMQAREKNQEQDTIRVSEQDARLIEQERLRILEAQQQQTRLGNQSSYPQTDVTQQMSAEQIKRISQQSISEQTIQRGAEFTPPPFGQQTGGEQQNTGASQQNTGVNSPFQTGGQQNTGQNQPFQTGGSPYQTGGEQYQTGSNQYQIGGNQPPPEPATFAGASTGSSGFQGNPVSTGGSGYSNNPISGNPAYVHSRQSLVPKKSGRKIFWILPVLALVFLAMGSVGLGFWLWRQSQTEETINKPTPTATATVAPTPSVASTTETSGGGSVNSASPTPTTTPATSSTTTTSTKTTKPQVETKGPNQPQPNNPRQQTDEPKARPKTKKTVNVDDIINDPDNE